MALIYLSNHFMGQRAFQGDVPTCYLHKPESWELFLTDVDGGAVHGPALLANPLPHSSRGAAAKVLRTDPSADCRKPWEKAWGKRERTPGWRETDLTVEALRSHHCPWNSAMGGRFISAGWGENSEFNSSYVLRYHQRGHHQCVIIECLLGVVKGREAWRPAGHGVSKSWTQLSDWTTGYMPFS